MLRVDHLQIAQLRERRCMTRHELAARAKIFPSTLARLECGKAVSPRTVRLVISAFGMTLDEAAVRGLIRREGD